MVCVAAAVDEAVDLDPEVVVVAAGLAMLRVRVAVPVAEAFESSEEVGCDEASAACRTSSSHVIKRQGDGMLMTGEESFRSVRGVSEYRELAVMRRKAQNPNKEKAEQQEGKQKKKKEKNRPEGLI